MSSESGLLPRAARQLLRRWQGVALTLIVGSVTLWLAVTGRLILYINPRYVVFTVIMIGIGVLLSLLALALADAPEHEHEAEAEHEAEHEHEAEPSPTARPRRGLSSLLSAGALLVTVAIVGALLILPPSTLSSATATTREVGSGGLPAGSNAASLGTTARTGASDRLTVLDWAQQLRQNTSLAFYEGKDVDVTGFISPAPHDAENSFLLTRFVITCCAVDAQPVGLLVYSPHWQGSLRKDQWVTIRGSFAANPSPTSTDPLALVPRSVTRVAQPHDPYLS